MKGFSSLTFLHEAAETIEAQGKPAFIYYFGDWDGAGNESDGHVYVPARWLAEEVDWFRKTEEQIRETADGVKHESYRGQE